MQTVHFAFQMKILILIFRLLKQEKIILWENNDNGLDIDKCEGLKYSSDNYLLRVNYYK